MGDSTVDIIDHNDPGWKPDKYLGTDFPYIRPKETWAKKVNLREDPKYKDFFDPVYDQGKMNSCVANASAACYRFEVRKQLAADKITTRQAIWPSRLFIYYNARASEYDVISDSGCENRDALKSLAKKGVCSEPNCPYIMIRDPKPGELEDAYEKAKDVETIVNKRPKPEAYAEAKLHQISKYYRLDTDRDPTKDITTKQKDEDGEKILKNLRICLSEGNAVIFGYSYQKGSKIWSNKGPNNSWILGSFKLMKRERHAEVPAPQSGHAVLAIGYDDDISAVLCQNSWGNGPTLKTFFWVPYEWITDFKATDDFWMIKVAGN